VWTRNTIYKTIHLFFAGHLGPHSIQGLCKQYIRKPTPQKKTNEKRPMKKLDIYILACSNAVHCVTVCNMRR
jgi:hypothetical protein